MTFLKTIKFRLTAFFCITTIILAVLACWAFFNYQKSTLLHQLQNRACTLVDSLAVNAGTPLLAEDLMQLSVLVSTECKRPDVLWAAIINHGGKVLMHSNINEIGKNLSTEYGTGNKGFPVIREDKLMEIRPIVINGKKIGDAVLSIDAAPVFNRINDFKLGLQAAVLVLTFFACMVFIQIIGHSLGPLGDLSHAAAKVGQGDLYVRIEETGGEELCNLARTFNRMTENLAQANRDRKSVV